MTNCCCQPGTRFYGGEFTYDTFRLLDSTGSLAVVLDHLQNTVVPRGVLCDTTAGRVLVVEPLSSGDGRVSDVDPTTLAVTQTYSYTDYGYTRELAVRGGSHYYIAAGLEVSAANGIRKFNTSFVEQGGSWPFESPENGGANGFSGIAADANGDVYYHVQVFGGGGTYAVRKIDASDTSEAWDTELAGVGAHTGATSTIAYDANNNTVYAASSDDVYALDASDGSGSGAPFATTTSGWNTVMVSVSPDGNYVAAAGNASGNLYVEVWNSGGTSQYEFSRASTAAVQWATVNNSKEVYVATGTDNSILKIDSTGAVDWEYDHEGSVTLRVDLDGNGDPVGIGFRVTRTV